MHTDQVYHQQQGVFFVAKVAAAHCLVNCICRKGWDVKTLDPLTGEADSIVTCVWRKDVDDYSYPISFSCRILWLLGACGQSATQLWTMNIAVVQQPRVEMPLVVGLEGHREWSSGLCSCFEDCNSGEYVCRYCQWVVCVVPDWVECRVDCYHGDVTMFPCLLNGDNHSQRT